jgi:CRP/FNR family transcriptional regulator
MRRINTSTDEKIKALQGYAFFSALDSSRCVEIAEHVQLYHFEAGESVFLENCPCAGLHIIQRGSVKLYKTSPQGREIILRILNEEKIFNEVAVLDGEVNPVSAAALEETDVWILDSEGLQLSLECQPELAQNIISMLCRNLRELTTLVGELSFYQITSRLARLLVKLPSERFYGKGNYRLTQEEIATHLGTVREVVARSLRELERSGAVRVSRAGIQITNIEVLNAWGQAPSKRR